MNSRGDEHFYNILAFPGFGQKSLLQVRGCHYWPGLKDSLVYEIDIDYDLVVRHWLGEELIDVPSELSLLLECIKDMQSVKGLVPAEDY